jgi:hypothetical protein
MIRVGYLHSAPLYNPKTRKVMQILDVNDEIKDLRSVLKESRQRVCFQAEVATVENFGKLLKCGVDLLHYSGHGLESGDLAFENEQGKVQTLEVGDLRAVLTLESAAASSRARSAQMEKRPETQVKEIRMPWRCVISGELPTNMPANVTQNI